MNVCAARTPDMLLAYYVPNCFLKRLRLKLCTSSQCRSTAEAEGSSSGHSRQVVDRPSSSPSSSAPPPTDRQRGRNLHQTQHSAH